MNAHPVVRTLLALILAGHLAMLPVVAAAHLVSHLGPIDGPALLDRSKGPAVSAPAARTSTLVHYWGYRGDLTCEFCVLFGHLHGKKSRLAGGFTWLAIPPCPSIATAPQRKGGRSDSAPPNNRSPPTAG